MMSKIICTNCGRQLVSYIKTDNGDKYIAPRLCAVHGFGNSFICITCSEEESEFLDDFARTVDTTICE